MGNQRAGLDFNDDTKTVNIEELAGKGSINKNTVDLESVQQVAEKSGFSSREGGARARRRRKKSPFTMQLGLKCRPEMRDLFQEMSEHLDVYDHTTFERALLALIEKEGTPKQLETYKGIIK
ncbi:MAG: hypothetical protein GY941_20335 [Planctomycetes bacterium]|nr:hypothetical protein [Planctomycetota bacterium]